MEETVLLEGWLLLDGLSPKILVQVLALSLPSKEGEIQPPGFCFVSLTEPPKENDLHNYSYY